MSNFALWCPCPPIFLSAHLVFLLSWLTTIHCCSCLSFRLSSLLSCSNRQKEQYQREQKPWKEECWVAPGGWTGGFWKELVSESKVTIVGFGILTNWSIFYSALWNKQYSYYFWCAAFPTWDLSCTSKEVHNKPWEKSSRLGSFRPIWKELCSFLGICLPVYCNNMSDPWIMWL